MNTIPVIMAPKHIIYISTCAFFFAISFFFIPYELKQAPEFSMSAVMWAYNKSNLPVSGSTRIVNSDKMEEQMCQLWYNTTNLSYIAIQFSNRKCYEDPVYEYQKLKIYQIIILKIIISVLLSVAFAFCFTDSKSVNILMSIVLILLALSVVTNVGATSNREYINTMLNSQNLDIEGATYVGSSINNLIFNGYITDQFQFPVKICSDSQRLIYINLFKCNKITPGYYLKILDMTILSFSIMLIITIWVLIYSKSKEETEYPSLI